MKSIKHNAYCWMFQILLAMIICRVWCLQINALVLTSELLGERCMLIGESEIKNSLSQTRLIFNLRWGSFRGPVAYPGLQQGGESKFLGPRPSNTHKFGGTPFLEDFPHFLIHVSSGK